MALTLYFHPLSSYCHKALIALYETDTPFKKHQVNLMDEAEAAAFKKIWPIGKFPVLVDDDGDGNGNGKPRTITESSVIIEYVGGSRLIPSDRHTAIEARAKDRFFDFYVNDQIGKIVTDRLRPEGKRDPLGVNQAKEKINTALDMVEREMDPRSGSSRTWATGDQFTIADIAASPSLFYANKLGLIGDARKHTKAYLSRLMERPAYARTLEEAAPFLKMVPEARG